MDDEEREGGGTGIAVAAGWTARQGDSQTTYIITYIFSWQSKTSVHNGEDINVHLPLEMESSERRANLPCRRNPLVWALAEINYSS